MFDDHEDGLTGARNAVAATSVVSLRPAAVAHCVETASNFLPHAILLDLAIPEHDGLEIPEQLLKAD